MIKIDDNQCSWPIMVVDTNLTIMSLQEFVEARRTAGLNNAPACLWSSNPPNELKEAPEQALTANAGFVSFGNG